MVLLVVNSHVHAIASQSVSQSVSHGDVISLFWFLFQTYPELFPYIDIYVKMIEKVYQVPITVASGPTSTEPPVASQVRVDLLYVECNVYSNLFSFTAKV